YMIKPLSYIEITSFYNRLRNLITRIDNNYYANYGKIGSYGIELDIKQNITPFTFFFNYSLLFPDTVFTDESFNKINVHKNEFCHFPKHTVNAGIHFNYKKLIDLSLFGQYASGFRSIQQYEVDDRLILNSGIGIKLAKRFILRFNVYNLFDKYYKLGDPSVIPVEQPGRWWNFSLMYEI
ncbi:MAG: TonB-dependent receptor, partial [Bacteroidales bacterium]